MKISIINYEAKIGINGILTKYAETLERELLSLGHDVVVLDEPDKNADINHHINFLAYKPSGTIDTTMVTHLTGDSDLTKEQKIKILKETLKISHGICMSKSEMNDLIKGGISKNKLSSVPHFHSNIIRRPRIITILSNVYPDGRKRSEMFVEAFRSLKDKHAIVFNIMGKGWKPLLEQLSKEGIQCNWQPEFNKELYQQLLNTSDYLLYTGDEDSLAQSVVDAKYVGLPIISPHHRDLEIDIPFKNQKELNNIFAKIEKKHVDDWTEANYAKQHENIWKNLL